MIICLFNWGGIFLAKFTTIQPAFLLSDWIGVFGYNNALMLGSFLTVDESLGCGSHIYHQKDYAASINSSTLVCIPSEVLPQVYFKRWNWVPPMVSLTTQA